MSLMGRWRFVEAPGYEADYADRGVAAYILFSSTGGGFAFGHVNGSFAGASKNIAAAFVWDGNAEMVEVRGDGWAELQNDGSLVGEINFHNGDEIPFIAQPQPLQQTVRGHSCPGS